MKRIITFALLCITTLVCGVSCKKADNTPVSIESVTPLNAATFQSNGSITIKWRTFGATKKSKVEVYLELYVKDGPKIRYVRDMYLEPTNKIDPALPFLTNNDSKEEFKINVGPDFLYKNGSFKLRIRVFSETNSAQVLGDSYWGGEDGTFFRIFHNGCNSDSKNQKSSSGLSCAITGIPRVNG